MLLEEEESYNAVFGRMWHSVTKLVRRDKQAVCYWCGEPETKRAWVNIWGTIHDVGACDICYKKNHGIARDSL